MINDLVHHSFRVIAENIWLLVSESLWVSIPIGVMTVAIIALARARLRDANISSSQNTPPLTAPRDVSHPAGTIPSLPVTPPDNQLELREVYIDLAHVSISPMTYRVSRIAPRRCYRHHPRSN